MNLDLMLGVAVGMEKLEKFAYLSLGFLATVIHLPVHGLLWVAFPAMALSLSNLWMGAVLFYALPLGAAFVVARWFCRSSRGVWVVRGSFLVYLILLLFNWDSNLKGGYGGCHSCGLSWAASATFLPVLLGQAWALWELRGRRQRAVYGKFQ